MTLALAFWILMLLWLAVGSVGAYHAGGVWQIWSGQLLPFLLFILLGWHMFGAPIHG